MEHTSAVKDAPEGCVDAPPGRPHNRRGGEAGRDRARAVDVRHAGRRGDALAHTVGDGQGVYAVSGDGTVLVAQAADRAVHPASVTKIATTLALLERLGPTYRFVTEVTATGPIRDGRVAGDLVIHAVGDP